MGTNPVQVEVGEFDEGPEEAEEEVVAESRSLPRIWSHEASALCHLGLKRGPSVHEVPSQGNAGWGPRCRMGRGGETALTERLGLFSGIWKDLFIARP